MEINNANLGNINSGGGHIQIGNNPTINIFDGITALSAEYKRQIKKIETLIYAFKPKTALELVLELKDEIEQSDILDKNKILSKILFLEGLCKNEIKSYDREESSKIFIQAYKLNPQDKDIKKRACVEYRFLNEIPRAIELAEELLQNDDFDITAWYVKTSISEDISAFLKTVPDVVKKNKNFLHCTIYDVIYTKNIQYLKDLEIYGLELNISAEDYTTVTFNNKGAWIIGIDLFLNNLLNNKSVRYIAGEKLIFENTPDFQAAKDLLHKFISALENTEISDTISHQKFLYNYISYSITFDVKFAEDLENSYQEIEELNWFYLSCLCQVLNHQKDYQKSFLYMEKYKEKGGILNTEYFIFKATIASASSKHELINDYFINYLDLIPIIDEIQGFNIINTFLILLRNDNIKQNVFQSIVEKILEKKFKTETLKSILEITINVRFSDNYNKEETFNNLNILKENESLNENYKSLIAENFNYLGYTKEAIDYLRNFINKNIISPSLKFYILLLNSYLHSDSDKRLTGNYKELLSLLEYWRINNKLIDIELLKIEHDLYYEINDWEKVRLINSILYSTFPDNEVYLHSYLISLEKLNLTDEISTTATEIKDEFDNENYGISICGIFLRNNNIETGFRILYKLASNKNNSKARGSFFGASLQFEAFLINYDVVSTNCWVSYQIGNEIHKIRIENDKDLSKHLLGKKVGDEFEITGGFNKKNHKVKILEITNDGLHLFREISEEARNPLNELGIQSFQLEEDTNIIEFLKENFGEIGSLEKVEKPQYLDDYYKFKLGFSEISRFVFNEKYTDTYFFLTQSSDSYFTTLPISATCEIIETPDINFALDFSSLFLFYTLEKEKNFIYQHKFHISYFIKSWIEEEINYIKNSPESSLSVQITTEDVQKFFIPENYKESRTEFLNSILEWINKTCLIDLVEEKLDITLKLDFEKSKEKFMKLLVDNMLLNNRPNYHLISSDSTLFLLARKNNDLYCNIISPEKYLSHFNPKDSNYEFYNFLLESNYLGIGINYETLKTEFLKLLTGYKNNYTLCLKNLQYYINPNPNNSTTICRFLNELYVNTTLEIEEKNKYAEGVLKEVIYGMPKELRISLLESLKTEFTPLGNYFYNNMSIAFLNALK